MTEEECDDTAIIANEAIDLGPLDSIGFDRTVWTIWATAGVSVVEKREVQIVIWKDELTQRKPRTAKLPKKDGIVLDPAAEKATGGAFGSYE